MPEGLIDETLERLGLGPEPTPDLEPLQMAEHPNDEVDLAEYVEMINGLTEQELTEFEMPEAIELNPDNLQQATATLEAQLAAERQQRNQGIQEEAQRVRERMGVIGHGFQMPRFTIDMPVRMGRTRTVIMTNGGLEDMPERVMPVRKPKKSGKDFYNERKATSKREDQIT